MPKTKTIIPETQPLPSEVTLVKPPFKILLEWKALSRPYKKQNREFFTTVCSIVFLLAVILLFLKEWLLIGAIIALTFFVYVLSSVPPEEVEYKITTHGISVADKTFPWERMGRFWFSEKWGYSILHIEYAGLPSQIMLVYDNKKTSKDTLKQLLGRYLVYEKPEKTPVDKAAEWLQKKVPLGTEPLTPKTKAS